MHSFDAVGGACWRPQRPSRSAHRSLAGRAGADRAPPGGDTRPAAAGRRGPGRRPSRAAARLCRRRSRRGAVAPDGRRRPPGDAGDRPAAPPPGCCSIPAGTAVPDHGHRGTELTLVLQGAFRDETDRFGPGDVEIADEALRASADRRAGRRLHLPRRDRRAAAVLAACCRASPSRSCGSEALLPGALRAPRRVRNAHPPGLGSDRNPQTRAGLSLAAALR